jgi:hypothetical protein
VTGLVRSDTGAAPEATMRRDHKRFNNRMNDVRNRIAEWAAKHHADDLQRGMEHCLGPRPRDTPRVHSALGFALVAPPPGGASLIERYIEAHPRASNRMERQVHAAWRTCRYQLLSVRSVRPGDGFVAEDVIRGDLLDIGERAATNHLAEDDWLLGFVLKVDGAHIMEGTAELLAAAAIQPLFAVLSAAGPAAADTRGAAWGAIGAMHAAYAASPDGSPLGNDSLAGLGG